MAKPEADSVLLPPTPGLQGCVRAFYWRHHDPAGVGGGADPYTAIPPGPYTAIVWMLSGGARLVERGGDIVDEPLPTVMVSGPRRHRLLSVATTPYRSFGLVLQPAALPLMAGVASAALAEQLRPAHEVLPADWLPWLQAVAVANSHAQRMALCESHLQPRWAALAGPASPWERLARAAWQRPLQHLAFAAARWTQRHFQRRTQALTGLRAGEVERLLRLEQALIALRDGQGSVAQVAAAAGYADQSHFTREARAVYGAPPAELMRRLRELPHGGDWLLRL